MSTLRFEAEYASASGPPLTGTGSTGSIGVGSMSGPTALVGNATSRSIGVGVLTVLPGPVRMLGVGTTRSIGVGVLTVPPPSTLPLLIREKPPLRLSWNVTTPAGYSQRWGYDDSDPSNVPSAATFSTTMPGGFENGSITLPRDLQHTYPDLELLSTVTALGAGGQVAWQGRIEELPDVGGDQSQINVQCVGWQSHLNDDDSAREIFVDRNITTWQGPSVARQIEWLQVAPPVVASGPAVAPDFTNQYPSLACTLQGAWSQSQVVEGWYDAHGMPIGELFASWETNTGFVLTGGSAFGAGMFLSQDDVAAGGTYDAVLLNYSPGTYVLNASTGNRAFAILQLWNDTVPGGQDGVSYSLFWTQLGVYGTHGLTLYTDPMTPGSAPGVLASDIIAYTVGRWAPKIRYTTGPGGTIQPSSFIIPQFAFLEPGTSSPIITQAASYELLDWAVWEEPHGVWPANPCMFVNARGARGSTWRTRTGPGQLQETGSQISSLWNGVIVVWNDVSGVTRSIGPPGSGCNFTSPALVTTDPQNPANQAGIRRWALVTMGVSTQGAATQIGGLFLQQQALLNTSGQATLTGYVEDQYGVSWPAWMVRAGDYLVVTDSHYPRPRRIVSTSWDSAARSNTLQLDQPPSSLAALLSRLSVVLNPIGI